MTHPANETAPAWPIIGRGDWHISPAHDLEATIAEFKAHLPGWWFSVGECQVSCDASCAPTVESPHIALIEADRVFDSGFHVDDPQPSTLATALKMVMHQALHAIVVTEARIAAKGPSVGTKRSEVNNKSA